VTREFIDARHTAAAILLFAQRVDQRVVLEILGHSQNQHDIQVRPRSATGHD